MPDVIVPMNEVNLPTFLSKQDYKIPTINQNMFSVPKREKPFKTMLPPTELKGVTIQRLWDNIFADHTSFLKRYHDNRSELDLVVGKWDYAPDMGSGYRFVSLVTVVEVPRAGTKTPLNEAHRFAYSTTESGGLLLLYQISSQTPNVPTGTSFRTEAIMFITADSATSSCSIEILGTCRKMSMMFTAIQGIATPRAISEMTTGYAMMVRMIGEELCDGEMTVAVVDDAGTKSNVSPQLPSTDAIGDIDAGGEESPGLAFQGVLLVLAFLITLVLLWSMSTIRSTANQTSAFMRTVTYQGGAGVGSGKGGFSQSSSTTTMTEDQALLNAAREAQIQTLRYRWMEQQNSISALENSVKRIWWVCVVQFIAIVGLCVRLFM